MDVRSPSGSFDPVANLRLAFRVIDARGSTLAASLGERLLVSDPVPPRLADSSGPVPSDRLQARSQKTDAP